MVLLLLLLLHVLLLLPVPAEINLMVPTGERYS